MDLALSWSIKTDLVKGLILGSLRYFRTFQKHRVTVVTHSGNLTCSLAGFSEFPHVSSPLLLNPKKLSDTMFHFLILTVDIKVHIRAHSFAGGLLWAKIKIPIGHYFTNITSFMINQSWVYGQRQWSLTFG